MGIMGMAWWQAFFSYDWCWFIIDYRSVWKSLLLLHDFLEFSQLASCFHGVLQPFNLYPISEEFVGNVAWHLKLLASNSSNVNHLLRDMGGKKINFTVWLRRLKFVKLQLRSIASSFSSAILFCNLSSNIHRLIFRKTKHKARVFELFSSGE